MVEAPKTNLQPNDQFKKAWFLNLLENEYAKHIDLMPTDDLDVSKTSARKLELGQMRGTWILNDNNNDEWNKDSEKKAKTKESDSTIDDIKTLKEKIEGLAMKNCKFWTCIICWWCQNEEWHSRMPNKTMYKL